MLDDIRKVSKHSIVYALGNISVKIVGLILIPLYTNPEYLSEAEYGILAILEISVLMIAEVLSLLSIELTLIILFFLGINCNCLSEIKLLIRLISSTSPTI